MSAIDENYKKVLKEIMTFGEIRPNRTGVKTIAIPSCVFRHDMSEGFPILHNKKISFKTSKVELIGFLLGITDKRWYQQHGCTIWDEWCRPTMIPEDLTKSERLDFMRKCPELGPIYGSQWRDFNGGFGQYGDGYDAADQIVSLLESLKESPDNRRMIVSAWNPLELPSMALPPCHFAFQVLVMGDKLHLNWSQRSVDTFLGLPYNICFYGTLLSCLAYQFGYELGMLTGFLGDTHLYENHLDQVQEYLDRPNAEDCDPFLMIPTNPKKFSILNESHMMKIKLSGYNPHPAIKADVAI